MVARNYLVNERPDAILNIVDGTNLERNLYLTTQLVELGIPVVVAINMIDLVKKAGDKIDLKELSRELGCQIVEISALKGTGIELAAETAIEAAKAVTEASGMDKVFFTNSGAEAVEGALKVARKYAYLKDGKTDHEIIAMNHSFHGRTFGALSVTGTEKYRAPFGPMIGNIKFAEINDLDSVKALDDVFFDVAKQFRRIFFKGT